MARGQKTGGRRKGSLNQRTLAIQEHVTALAESATPLDLLMSVYRNPELPIALRVHAAAKAAPYVHRQLKSVEQSGEGGGPMRIEIGWEKPSQCAD
jgi:hypothetical protein